MLAGHMNAKHAHRLLLLAVLLAAIVLAPAARAQEDDRAPVRLDGRTLFRIGPSGELDAAQRARRVELRLEALLDSPNAINPVSYTHLDVYKRQVAYWPNASGRKTLRSAKSVWP